MMNHRRLMLSTLTVAAINMCRNEEKRMERMIDAAASSVDK